jgi:hypothetical protein
LEQTILPLAESSLNRRLTVEVPKACCAILLSEKALDFCGISPSELGGSRKK